MDGGEMHMYDEMIDGWKNVFSFLSVVLSLLSYFLQLDKQPKPRAVPPWLHFLSHRYK